MLRKFFTIVVIPRRTSRVRKIQIPVILTVTVFVLLVAGLILWGYMVTDYFSMRNRLTGMEKLTRKALEQRQRILQLNDEMEMIDLHFENLEALNRKLRRMTRQGVEDDAQSIGRNRRDVGEMVAKAEKDGILSVIASDISEIDSELAYEQEIRFQNLIRFFREQTNPTNRIPNRLPVKGYQANRFGFSLVPYAREGMSVDGIDIITRNFQPVEAPADGLVVNLSGDKDLGKILVIDHGNGFITRYGHLASYEVAEGEIVRRGNVIGQAGNTGHTTGPRLYYQVLFNGIPQDPNRFVTENES